MEKGINKSAQRALEAYPSTPNWDERITRMYRGGFIKGYRQAEKDLELTWEDIRDICSIQYIVLSEYNDYDEPSSSILYQEVLKRFKERKEK